MRSCEHTRGIVRVAVQAPHRLCYRCGTCGAGFTTQLRLAAHLERAYHGFQCLTCGAVYATRGTFILHARQAHGQNLAERSP